MQNKLNEMEEMLEKITRCYWIEYGDDKKALETLAALIASERKDAKKKGVIGFAKWLFERKDAEDEVFEVDSIDTDKVSLIADAREYLKEEEQK